MNMKGMAINMLVQGVKAQMGRVSNDDLRAFDAGKSAKAVFDNPQAAPVLSQIGITIQELTKELDNIKRETMKKRHLG